MKDKPKDKDRLKFPICPYCETKMSRVKFNGYYDNFDYWDCNCGDDEVPIDHVFRSSP